MRPKGELDLNVLGDHWAPRRRLNFDWNTLRHERRSDINYAEEIDDRRAQCCLVSMCEGRFQDPASSSCDRWDVDNNRKAEYILAIHRAVPSCKISVDKMVEDIGRSYLQRDVLLYHAPHKYGAPSKREHRVRHGFVWLFATDLRKAVASDDFVVRAQSRTADALSSATDITELARNGLKGNIASAPEPPPIMLDCLPSVGMPCPLLFFLKFITDLLAKWRRRKNAAEVEEKVQGEEVQERLQRLNMASIIEWCMSVCQSVLQEMSDNARVAVVSNVLLQHMKACSTSLGSIVNTKIREVCVRDMCRAYMYLSEAQQKSVAQRVQETIHMTSKQTFCFPMHRLVHARRDWKAMIRTLVDDIAFQAYRTHVSLTDTQILDHCTPPVHR